MAGFSPVIRIEAKRPAAPNVSDNPDALRRSIDGVRQSAQPLSQFVTGARRADTDTYRGLRRRCINRESIIGNQGETPVAKLAHELGSVASPWQWQPEMMAIGPGRIGNSFQESGDKALPASRFMADRRNNIVGDPCSDPVRG